MRTAVLGVVALAMLLVGASTMTQRSGTPRSDRAAGNADAAFVRGVALGLFATDPDWDYGGLLEEIADRGATDVLLVVNAYQSNRFSSDIALAPGRSPSEAAVARTIRQTHALKMRAAIMPVVRLRDREPWEWRGLIAPADGLDAWFAAYRRFVLPLARVAEAEGAQRFIVGSELSSLERYESHWRAVIDDVRAEFSGVLVYSANFGQPDVVAFWDALDEVGLNSYFPVATELERVPTALARGWQAPRAEIEALAARAGKPVLVTEVGYPSRVGAAARPWDDASDTGLDLRAQQQLYRGFCDAFFATPSVSGFYVWNWFGVGGPRDTGFTPRGKPASVELEKCFARDWSARITAGNRS